MSPSRLAGALRTVQARFHGFQTSPVLGEDLELRQARPHAAEQLLLERRPVLRQGVELPLPLAPHPDEARPPQDRQVAGDLGLDLPEDLAQVADADLALQQQVEEAQPGGVRKGAEEVGRLEAVVFIYG